MAPQTERGAGAGAQPQWSPDHQWWWDGQRWVPASQAPQTLTAGGQPKQASTTLVSLSKEDKKKADEDRKKAEQQAKAEAKRLDEDRKRAEQHAKLEAKKAEEDRKRTELQAKLARQRGGSDAPLPMDKLHGRAMKLLAQSLGPGEPVVAQLNGVSNNQALVLTDHRALIIKVGWMTGQTLGGKVTSFDYRNISSVEVRTSIMTGTFEISAGGVQGFERSYYGTGKDSAYHAPNVIAIGKGQQATFQRAANFIREKSRAAAQPVSVAAPAPPDIPDQLRKLAELKQQGILTDAEFEIKKAELLARL